MKMVFVVYNDYVDAQVIDMLKTLNIDYYTHWDRDFERLNYFPPGAGVPDLAVVPGLYI